MEYPLRRPEQYVTEENGMTMIVTGKTRKARLLGLACCAAVLAVLAGIISTDFNQYFIMFHHIFFNNDLWMLNPDTDLLINIVPEPFFMDTAARIAMTYGVSVLTVFAICFIILYYYRKKQEKQI